MNGAAGWLGAFYPLMKAFHISFVIFWIAGLFMLPRYLIYQAGVDTGSAEDRNWRQRTRRIHRIILRPMIVLVWLSGLSLATSYGFEGQRWLDTKILLVLVLSGYHWWMVRLARAMAAGRRPVAEKALRFLNEVPGLMTIVIVILVVLKPF